MTSISPAHPQLTIIPRSEHIVSRELISDAALKVLYRLNKAGHRACLVGGGVRDVLLGKHPKDFDVGTDATPEEVRALFRNSRIIGRRFRLVHIRFGREIIEVATFRAHEPDSDHTELDESGRIVRDNSFGSIEEDAMRRDFTVNAMYYDIHDFSVLDYAGGINDIENRTLRLIGNASTRYQEDPVRMLRAVRFAAKLDFDIEEQADQQIHELGHLLADIPPARLFDEIIKLFHCGNAVRAFELLRHYRLLAYLFPGLADYLGKDPDASMLDFIDQALANTDLRIKDGKSVSPAFIFAALLWPMVHRQAMALSKDSGKLTPALHEASKSVFAQQIRHVSIPRRFSQTARDIWTSQPRFSRTRGNQPARFATHPVFRAAYDFMCLQTMVGLCKKQTCDWWTEFQTQDKPPEKTEKPPRRRRRGGRRRKRPSGNDSE